MVFVFQDMHLWYPESKEDLKFVGQLFSTSSPLQVGIREVFADEGTLNSDYSIGLGVSGLIDETTEELDLMSDGQCFMAELSDQLLWISRPCPPSPGLCQAKLSMNN